MIRSNVRKIASNLGYDIIKTENFEFGRQYMKASIYPDLDYYETPTGNYYFPKNCNGDDVANTIKRGHIFDQAILSEALKHIKPNSTILDVGANFGQMSIEFSRSADNVQVYAFEAQKLVYEVLTKNLKANGCHNASAVYNAVFDKHGHDMYFPEADLQKFKSFGSYGLDLKSRKGNVLKSIMIDNMHFDLPVSFMKIDIQGSDLAAMRGAVNTIEKYQMPIVFEYEEQFQTEFGTSFQDYIDFVNSIGYKFLKTIQDINFVIVPR
jgi:FkbM family methyltransferase